MTLPQMTPACVKVMKNPKQHKEHRLTEAKPVSQRRKPRIEHKQGLVNQKLLLPVASMALHRHCCVQGIHNTALSRLCHIPTLTPCLPGAFGEVADRSGHHRPIENQSALPESPPRNQGENLPSGL